MTLTILAKASSLALALTCSLPAIAQDSSYKLGEYWDVTDVKLEDGQSEAYLDWLAKSWKADQEFAKKKGYIEDYHVLANTYNRPGEPDLYLVIVYKKVYDTPEQERQRKEYEATVKKDIRQLEAESGGRVTMRKIMGNAQLRELLLK